MVEEYEAEQRELDHPLPPGRPEPIPAEDSITGEEVTTEEQEEPMLFGLEVEEAGEATAEGEEPGRGLVNGGYVRLEDGSVYGMAAVEDIGLSGDVPQFKKKESAAGRVEADEDGTTHELSGGWNAKTDAIIVWRRASGKLEVISGRHRLAHARKNGVKHIAVRVYDEDAEHDANWAKLYDVEVNILANTCNAIDVAYYFRHNPMSLAEAEARGLMPKTRAGEQTAASRMGIEIAARASDDTFAALVNGVYGAEDVYTACRIAGSPEGQALALTERQGKNGKKQSWEYVTALVRGSEQMSGGGAMLDLFGWDTSFKEKAEKMARYVEAVRGQLKQRINVLASAGSLQRRGEVARQEGVKAERPKDAVERIARLAAMDAAYERMDAGLGIAEKADAWDGKSKVEVDEGELEGASFSVTDAKAQGMFKDGVMETGNAVITEPTFSIQGAQHASPHKFKQFDLEHIGSGEGAQAYGWGVYFSSNWGVNRSYHDSFSNRGWRAYDSKGEVRMGEVVKLQLKYGVDREVPWLIPTKIEDYDALIENAINKDYKLFWRAMKRRGILLLDPHAMNYLSDLNVEEGELLDWDKKTNAFSMLEWSEIRDRLYKKYGENIWYDGWFNTPNSEYEGYVKALREYYEMRKEVDMEMSTPEEQKVIQEIYDAYTSYMDSRENPFAQFGDDFADCEDGKQFYRKLSQKQGSAKAASEWLLERGIKGIRYADGVTRNREGEKSYNYVIFDPAVIEIRKVADRKPWSSDTEDAGTWQDYGEWSGSFSIQIAAERVCRTAAEAKRMIGRNGAPVRLENTFLQLEAEVSQKSERKFLSGDSMNKTFESLEQVGLKRDDILTLHYTAMGNIAELFANGERMKFERAYKKKDSRKGMLHVYSPFTVKGVNGEYEADIELLIHQEKGTRPTAYVLAVSVDKKLPTASRGVDASFLMPMAAHEIATRAEASSYALRDVVADIQAEFPEIVKGENAGSESFSVRGRGSVLDRVNLREMAEEEAVVRLMNRARRGINRWRRVFEWDETGAAQAAQALGEVGSVMEAVLQYLPAGERPHYGQEMKLVEAYARLVETGRVRRLNREAKGDEARLRQEVLREVQEEVEKIPGLRGEALREVREKFVRDVAERRMGDVVLGMVEDAVGAMERHLVRREVGRLEGIAERLKPKKQANGKLARGKMSAGAYREFVRLYGLVNMTAAERDERLAGLAREIEAADEGKAEELGEAVKEVATFGALREAGLRQARAGVRALVEYVRSERAVWREAGELEKRRMKRIARVAAEGMGGVDPNAAARKQEGEGRLRGMMGAALTGFQSLSQMFYGMQGVAGLEGFAGWSLDKLARGNNELILRERQRFAREVEFMARELGLDTEGKRNDFMAELKKLRKSGVKKAGRLLRHRVRLRVEEAREVVDMTKKEREARNERLRSEAEGLGVDAENIVTDEDVTLLREELAAAEAGGAREYVQVEREWRAEGTGAELLLTRDQALNIILICEQADYAEAADANGYTAEVLEALRKFVGEDVMRYGYFMRDMLEGSGLAEVYEEREGVPFPRVENYWPGRFDQSSRVNEGANAFDRAVGSGTAYGMLIKRVRHQLNIDESVGATNSYRAAAAQQDNYIVLGDLTARWRKLLAHADFALALKTKLGGAQMRTFKSLLNLVDGIGDKAGEMERLLSKFVTMMQSAHATAVLAGGIPTLIKQASAIANGLVWGEVPFWEYMRAMVAPGAASLRDIAGLESVRVRFEDGEEWQRMTLCRFFVRLETNDA